MTTTHSSRSVGDTRSNDFWYIYRRPHILDLYSCFIRTYVPRPYRLPFFIPNCGSLRSYWRSKHNGEYLLTFGTSLEFLTWFLERIELGSPIHYRIRISIENTYLALSKKNESIYSYTHMSNTTVCTTVYEFPTPSCDLTLSLPRKKWCSCSQCSPPLYASCICPASKK